MRQPRAAAASSAGPTTWRPMPPDCIWAFFHGVPPKHTSSSVSRATTDSEVEAARKVLKS